MERVSEQHTRSDERLTNEQIVLLYIRGAADSCLALRRAAQRIRGSIRCSDTVLLLDRSCVIVLAGTPLSGAQTVARRVYGLLVDVEYDLQILCGPTAQTLLHSVQKDHAVIVQKEMPLAEAAVTVRRHEESGSATHGTEAQALPYLAFLPGYPAQRLLHLLPYELAHRHHCIPVGAERGVLTVATCAQLATEVVAQFRSITQRAIFQVRCEESMIEDVLAYWQRALLA